MSTPSSHPSYGGLPIVLGGNVFGFTADEDASFAVLDRFYEAGGRMIDTAQGYSLWVPGHVGGESEAVLGKWMSARGNRKEMLIATKTGMEGDPGDLEPAKVAEELHKSLDRLQTDYVDCYYVHKDEPGRQVIEIAHGFGSLLEQGLTLELGVSNMGLDRLRALNSAAQSAGSARFAVLQNEYNLVVRNDYDADYAAYCAEQDILHFPWMGLGAGFLTGKYRTPEDLKRFNRGGSVQRFFEQGLTILPVLDEVSAETGASLGAISLAWLSAQPGITAPIASASKPEQLDLHFEALKLELRPEQLAKLTAAGA